MASKLHQGLIAQLLERRPRARRLGFRAELRRTMRAAMGDDDTGTFSRRPDAFEIDVAEETVTCYEVDVDGPLDDGKIRDYAELWFDVDYIDWTLRLVVIDRYGREAEIDLERWWHTLLELAAA